VATRAAQTAQATQTILITGGAGRIGQMLRTRLARPDRLLRLLDVTPPKPAATGEHVEVLPAASVTDADAVRRAVDGADAIVHLGGVPTEGPWPDILSVNIDGTRTVLEAARLAGVPKLVLASSNHAVGFHRTEAPAGGLPDDVPARPDTYYGLSKATLEVLGSLYHDRFGMAVTCLRIGLCAEAPPDTAALPIWLSPDDMARLTEAALTATGYRIVWGVSANTRRWWSTAGGDAIGYHPVDDSEVYAHRIPRVPDDRLLGGMFPNAPLGEPM
jgi:uronate dehydrogenase